MEANYPEIYKAVRVFEGGNDDDPHDPGGRTSRGIIQREYDKYRDRKGLPRRDVWTASESEIAEIYKNGYWVPQWLASIVSGLDETQFDYGVNSGIGRSQKVLRRCLHMADRAPNTDLFKRLNGLTKDQAHILIDAVCDERMAFLRGLKTWKYYGKGWSRRVTKCRAIAHHLANFPCGVEAPVPLPAPDPRDGGSQKGQHPEPKAAKNAVKTGGTGGGAGAIAGWHDWIMSHQIETALIAVAAVALIVGIIYLINKQHKKRQEAPPAGWKPPAALIPTG